ncbi:hypothetical protein SLA2020_282950 [Shorea laevis]
MSLLGILKFALKFLHVLAWPLFALGYPLYASIRAIENNSNSETQKLVTYWISFSLVSLFEHSFVNLLQWIQFWPHIKLMIICWLVIPYFNGAFYVYNRLVRPCLLLSPQVIVDEFNKWMVFLCKRDHFLAEAERYIKGNVPEALEKLIDKEFKTKTPNVDVEDIKAIAAIEKKEVEWSSNKEPEIVQKDNKAVKVIEKKEVHALKRMVLAEPSLDQTDNRTLAINEIKGPDVAVPAAKELPEIPTESEKTLNICQVTIESEKNKATYEAPEANNQPNIVNFGSFLTVLDSTEKRTYQPIEKPQEIESTNGLKWQGQPKSALLHCKGYDCPKNSGKGNLVSHFKGKKHLAQVQLIMGGDVGDSSKSGNTPPVFVGDSSYLWVW